MNTFDEKKQHRRWNEAPDDMVFNCYNNDQCVEEVCHCWLVQQCNTTTLTTALLDKPAVAPNFWDSYFSTGY